MELPPVNQNTQFVNIPANQDIAALLSKLQPGATIEAQVKAIISDGLFLISFMDSFVEVESDQPLNPGQLLQLKVKSQSPVLTLEIAGKSPAPAAQKEIPQAPAQIPADPKEILARLSQPASKENLKAAEVILKYNLPVNKETFDFIVKNLVTGANGDSETKLDSAALMLSKGLPHSIRLLDALVKTVANPMSVAQTITGLKTILEQLAPNNPALQPLLDEINSSGGLYRLTQTPDTEALKQAVLKSGQPQFAGLIAGFESAIANALQADSLLKMLDELLQKIDSTAPAKTPISANLNQLIEIITKSPNTPQITRQLTDAIGNMDVKTLAQFKLLLSDLEQNTIAKMPELADLNKIAPLIRDLSDTLMALKSLNLTSQSFADNTFYVQIPTMVDGNNTTLLLKIHQRQKGQGKYAGMQYTGITINVELSRTGMVTAFIELFAPKNSKEKKKANILFKVPNRETKKAFENDAFVLINELDAVGYNASVNVIIRGPSEKPIDLSEYFQANGRIDITI
ncbi:MAG: hypothetical protein HZA48_01800 [Planctomycetes bacterium]|nr:hypothetical protein [Planctomycetota bacterium]